MSDMFDKIKNMVSSSSINTLKSLKNAHTIRGIATLKDVERFPKGHFESYREFIVKLPIVNYLSNKLQILSKANTILTNQLYRYYHYKGLN